MMHLDMADHGSGDRLQHLIVGTGHKTVDKDQGCLRESDGSYRQQRALAVAPKFRQAMRNVVMKGPPLSAAARGSTG
jgi:hypothetical protein